MSYSLSLFTDPEFENFDLENDFQHLVAEEDVLDKLAEHGIKISEWTAFIADGEDPKFFPKSEMIEQLVAGRDRAEKIDEDEFDLDKQCFIDEINMAIDLANAIPDNTQIALVIG